MRSAHRAPAARPPEVLSVRVEVYPGSKATRFCPCPGLCGGSGPPAEALPWGVLVPLAEGWWQGRDGARPVGTAGWAAPSPRGRAWLPARPRAAEQSRARACGLRSPSPPASLLPSRALGARLLGGLGVRFPLGWGKGKGNREEATASSFSLPLISLRSPLLAPSLSLPLPFHLPFPLPPSF